MSGPDVGPVPAQKREFCAHCARPAKVCLCPATSRIPGSCQTLRGSLIVLQHPLEARCAVCSLLQSITQPNAGVGCQQPSQRAVFVPALCAVDAGLCNELQHLHDSLRTK